MRLLLQAPERLPMLQRRCLEVCASYPEFWLRCARQRRRSNQEEALQLLHFATTKVLKRRYVHTSQHKTPEPLQLRSLSHAAAAEQTLPGRAPHCCNTGGSAEMGPRNCGGHLSCRCCYWQQLHGSVLQATAIEAGSFCCLCFLSPDPFLPSFHCLPFSTLRASSLSVSILSFPPLCCSRDMACIYASQLEACGRLKEAANEFEALVRSAPKPSCCCCWWSITIHRSEKN